MCLKCISCVNLFVYVEFENYKVVLGIKKGGVLIVVCLEVELNVLVGEIFEQIVVDLIGKEIGDVINILDVILLVGVKLIIDCDFVIVNIIVFLGLVLVLSEEGDEEVVEE